MSTAYCESMAFPFERKRWRQYENSAAASKARSFLSPTGFHATSKRITRSSKKLREIGFIFMILGMEAPTPTPSHILSATGGIRKQNAGRWLSRSRFLRRFPLYKFPGPHFNAVRFSKTRNHRPRYNTVVRLLVEMAGKVPEIALGGKPRGIFMF